MARNVDMDENGVILTGRFKGTHTTPPSRLGGEREIVWHREVAPTKVAGPSHGDDGSYGEEHPAFGMIRASRGTGGGSVLFDSDIKHNHTITVSIHTASRDRNLSRDWIHSDLQPLIEVEMSEAQWASFVSSMNTSGVPCTLRMTESNANVDGLPYEPRLKESMAEVRGAAKKIQERLDVLLKAVEEKPTKANIKNLRHALNGIGPNTTFVAKSLEEHAENVVQKARVDIEAMVTARAVALGIDPQSMTFSLQGEAMQLEVGSSPRPYLDVNGDEEVFDPGDDDPGRAVGMDGEKI